MQALITFTVEWIKKPSADLLYFFDINGVSNEVTEAKSKVFFWDQYPWRQIYEVSIAIEKKQGGFFSSKASDLDPTVCSSTEKFKRKINHKANIAPKSLDLPGYLRITDIECSVSKFMIPEWDPVLGTSPLFYEVCKKPEDASHLSLYFQDFNRDQLALSKEHERSGALFLVIENIVSYLTEDNPSSNIVVYYKSQWVQFPEQDKGTKDIEQSSEASETSSTSSSEVENQVEEKKEVKLIDL